MTKTPDHLSEAPKIVELLTDVLRRVRLANAIFLRGEFSAPWGFASCDAATLAQVVAPGAKRLVLLHLAVEGGFHIELDTGEHAEVAQGDAVILPYCDVHRMSSPRTSPTVPIVELLPMPPWQTLPVTARIEGGGAPTRVLCGYLHCDDLLFDPMLGVLPRLIHVPGTSEVSAQWREASLRYTLEHAGKPNASAELLARVPELVLVDCLQQFARNLPPEQTGWLASLRDPVIARALQLLHTEPAIDWTVEELASKTAVSRSVLADRFTKAIGQSPMQYLAAWRMQLATDMLRTTDLGIAEIAARVGYESEAAFSRAFKRHAGTPPASFREARS